MNHQNVYGYIYIVKDFNDKMYIGQTSKTGKSFEDYFGSGKYIRRAIRKYGKNWFKKTVIGECYSKEELNKAEIESIKFFNSIVPNGYNISPGGFSNRRNIKLTEERKKLSSCKGEKNGMYNTSAYKLWIQRYGIEIANKLLKERSEKFRKNLDRDKMIKSLKTSEKAKLARLEVAQERKRKLLVSGESWISKSTAEKISKANTGKIRSEEARKNYRKAHEVRRRLKIGE